MRGRRNKRTSPGMVILYVALILLILLFMFSCGTRKKSINSQETVNNQTEKTISQGNVSKVSSDSSVSTTKQQNAKVDENVKTTTTTKYGTDGKPTETTTTTETRKSTDNSTKQKERRISKILRVDSNFYNDHYKTIKIRERIFEKNVDANTSIVKNVGGWGVIVIGIIVVVISIVLINFIKTRK